MKKSSLLLVLSFIFIACGSDDDNNTPADVAVDLRFSQIFDEFTVTSLNLSTTVYVNEMNQELTISRLRYLVSRLVLTNANGDSFSLSPYHLVDLSNSQTLNLNTDMTVPEGDYTLSFVYGFNEEDNQDGAYADLNAVSWNWPQMLGGGYHFLQMDGQYNVNTEPAPFNFHNGTAKVSEGVFEQNFVVFNLPNTLTISEDSTINIQMNIAEWFRNPNTWDFNVLNTQLMPNYQAQKLMQQNAATVFSASIE
ncbi:MAG: MbnP family protein [Flavobacteriaceae bacterium]